MAVAQRSRALGALLGLGLALGLGATPAQAKPGKGGKPASKPPVLPATDASPGERQYQEAMRAFSAGERGRAQALFTAALAELPATHALYTKTLYNLAFLADADAEVDVDVDAKNGSGGGKAGASCDAARAYTRYLDAAPPSPEHERTRGLAQSREPILARQCEDERAPVVVPVVTTIESAPEPGGTWKLPVAAAATLIAAGAGVGLQVWAQSAIDERDQSHAAYLEVADAGAAERKERAARGAQDDAETRVLGSYVAFGLGGALLGLTAWLFFTREPGATQESGAHLELGVAPTALGLSGRF